MGNRWPVEHEQRSEPVQALGSGWHSRQVPLREKPLAQHGQHQGQPPPTPLVAPKRPCLGDGLGLQALWPCALPTPQPRLATFCMCTE